MTQSRASVFMTAPALLAERACPLRSCRGLCAILIMLGTLALAGCYLVSPVEQASADDVENRSFAFTSGAVFHMALANIATTLAFNNNATTFTLSSAGGTASGSPRFGSCALTVTSSTYTAGNGPQVDEVITLEPCDFDSSDNTLTLGRGSLMATSAPATDLTSGNNGDNRQATVNDVNNRTFTFTNGAVFDTTLTGVTTALAFSNSATTFTLSSASGTASGSHRFGSCILTVSASTYLVGSGPQVAAVIILDPCTFNSTNITLTVSNRGVTATSEPGR